MYKSSIGAKPLCSMFDKVDGFIRDYNAKKKKIKVQKKKTIKIWDADVDDIVLSKLISTKNNSEYLIGYLAQNSTN